MANAFYQPAAGGSNGKTSHGLPGFFEPRQSRRVIEWIGALVYDYRIAALFPLDTHAMRQPPDGGVIEEDGLGDVLQQVYEIVVAPDVRELVHEDGIRLTRRQPGQSDHRQH